MYAECRSFAAAGTAHIKPVLPRRARREVKRTQPRPLSLTADETVWLSGQNSAAGKSYLRKKFLFPKLEYWRSGNATRAFINMRSDHVKVMSVAAFPRVSGQ